jgi:integrase
MSVFIYKRGRIWWLAGSGSHRHIKARSTGLSDKAAAETYRRRIERELADPDRAAANQATFASAAARFLKETKRENISDATRSFYEQKVAQLGRVLGGVRLADLNHDMVLRYTEKREAETATRNTVSKELIALRRVLKSATRAGDFLKDHHAVIPKYSPQYEPKREFLTEDEVIAVCRQLQPKRAAWVAFAIATSARLSEIRRARREDVSKSYILVRGTKTEGSLRRVPVLSIFWPLVAFALTYADGKGGLLFSPWVSSRRDILAACKRAAVTKHVTTNTLRHTTATWLVTRAVSFDLAAKVMGHASTAMLRRVYAHLEASDVGRLIEGQLHGAE